MNDKKVILINGKNSNWYEQAIFIINKKEKTLPKNLVKEAEKIINKHLRKKYPNKNIKVRSNKKNNIKYLNSLLNVCIISSILVIFCLAYQLII